MHGCCAVTCLSSLFNISIVTSLRQQLSLFFWIIELLELSVLQWFSLDAERNGNKRVRVVLRISISSVLLLIGVAQKMDLNLSQTRYPFWGIMQTGQIPFRRLRSRRLNRVYTVC